MHFGRVRNIIIFCMDCVSCAPKNNIIIGTEDPGNRICGALHYGIVLDGATTIPHHV
jgi:hypothetical protein